MPFCLQAYDNVRSSGKRFEIVFASRDKNQVEFDVYKNQVPGLAIPYTDRDAVAMLREKYKVKTIPTLIMVAGQSNTN